MAGPETSIKITGSKGYLSEPFNYLEVCLERHNPAPDR